jgi:hypothetical protein
MQKVITNYRSFITSREVNESRAPFIRPGRYWGFDDLTSGVALVPEKISLKVIHDRTAEVLDENNQVQHWAIAVTNHGVIFETDDEFPILVSENPNSSNERVDLLVMNYAWVNEEVSNSPVIYVLQGPLVNSLGDVPSLDSFPITETMTPLAFIRVQPGGNNSAACSLEVINPPAYAGNPFSLDTSQFAKLNIGNLFEEINSYKVSSGDLSDFIVPSKFWVLSSSSNPRAVIHYNLNNVSLEVNQIADGLLPNNFGVYYVTFGGSNTEVTLIPGSGIGITTKITIKSGDSIILYKDPSFKWRVFVNDVIDSDLVLREDTQNNFKSLPVFTYGQASIEDGVMYCSDTPGQTITYLGYESGVSRILKPNGSEFPLGTSLSVFIDRGPNEEDYFVKLTLKATSSNDHGFFLSREDIIDPGLEYALLPPGSYTFTRINTLDNRKWVVKAAGPIWYEKVTFITGSSATPLPDPYVEGVWNELSYRVNTHGLGNLTLDFEYEEYIGGNIPAVELPTQFFSGLSKLLYPINHPLNEYPDPLHFFIRDASTLCWTLPSISQSNRRELFVLRL